MNVLRDFSRLPRILRFALCAAAHLASNGPLVAQEVRYNRDVLPILSENCFTCHGFDSGTRQAGLRLDRFEEATGELESGVTAVVPGNAQRSELLRRINATDPDQRMPPPESGRTLTADQIATLRCWIEQGARYEPHWAFIPPQRIEPPVISGVEQPIDRFIGARLATENLTPAAPADRATLIRRVSFDLIGLPPTPEEVDAFIHDERPDAYEVVVDRLLASERFGERWARWWLDLAHYADSDGYLQDFLRPVAWRYRQWVVEALNRDQPFDQFTIEQLAGDLLPDATVAQRIATGFLRNTLSNREGGADLEEYRVRQVVDRTVTTSTVWMGLTIGCAECHDHKFDPLAQREFYGLYAFFNDADEANVDAPLPGEAEHVEKQQAYARQRAELLAPLAEPLAELQADWEKAILRAETHPGDDQRWDRALEILGLVWGQGQGEGQLEGLMIVKTPLAERTQSQRDRLLDYFLKNGSLIAPDIFQDLNLAELAVKLDALAKDVPPISRAQAMVRSPTPRLTRLHMRGNFRNPGDTVSHSVPAILPPLAATQSRPDRLALARWLVAPDHPLMARVTVNRLWQELFGRGLVATSDNFGIRGERPTHPELLDWLALDFSSGGWSVKSLLRQMVLSQTYRQSSHARPELGARDPNNRLFARQNRLRLSAEAVRDSALVAGGLLDLTVGGPSVRPAQPAGIAEESYAQPWVADRGALAHRRGLYTFVQRLSPFVQFANFDMPSTSRVCTLRERSNTPLQALNLLNDPTFVEAARGLASRVGLDRAASTTERLERAFVIALARPPSATESARLAEYLDRQTNLYANDAAAAKELSPDILPGATTAESAAWVALASVLLNLDEFVNRE